PRAGLVHRRPNGRLAPASPRYPRRVTTPAGIQKKIRQLDNDVQAIYELLTGIQATQTRQGNRLDEIAATQAEQSTVLAEQSTVLAERSTVLAEHSTVLAEQSTVLAEHSTVLAEHSTILAEHSTILAGHGTMLTSHGTMLAENGRKLDTVLEILRTGRTGQ